MDVITFFDWALPLADGTRMTAITVRSLLRRLEMLLEFDTAVAADSKFENSNSILFEFHPCTWGFWRVSKHNFFLNSFDYRYASIEYSRRLLRRSQHQMEGSSIIYHALLVSDQMTSLLAQLIREESHHSSNRDVITMIFSHNYGVSFSQGHESSSSLPFNSISRQLNFDH